MKAILISLAAFLMLPLTSCRESPALVALQGTDLTLGGFWYESEPSEANNTVWAHITDTETEVYMRTDTGIDYLMWQGTYTEPKGKPDRYLWVSTNTMVRNESAAYMGGSILTFEYYDGQVSFQRNVDTEVSMTRWVDNGA